MSAATAPALGPGTTAAGLATIATAVGPIDWYLIALLGFTPEVDVPLGSSGTSIPFRLSDIAPASAAAVRSAADHVDAWLQTPGPVHPEPGVRDALQHSLFAVLADTGTSFAQTAASLQQLLAAIAPTGATAEQRAAATASLDALRDRVAAATAAITTARQQFGAFAAAVMADVTALQNGAASLQAAIDGFGQWYVNAVTHLQSSPLTIGADLRMLQDYATAYRQSLTTLQTELQQGIAQAGPAGAAVLDVAEQWATLQQTTAHVADQLAAATAQSLASDLTALDLAAAAAEWTTIQALAQSILTTMAAFPIPRPEGP
jgi:hypothetical protein